MEKVLFFLMMLGAVQGFAADGGSVPVEAPKPQIVKAADGQTYLSLPDGRVAGFFIQIGTSKRVSTAFRQIENTCDFNQALSDCRLELDVAKLVTQVQWVKHSDPTKLGQVVEVFSSSENKKLDTTEQGQIRFWYDWTVDRAFANKLKADRIVCDNLNWTQGLSVINARMTIDSWSSEFMVQSPETGMNENQGIGQAYDVVLRKIDNKTLEFESFGKAKKFASLPPHISTQVSNLVFLDKNKKQCQVSFEASLDGVQKEVDTEEFNKIDPTTRTQLINYKTLNFTELFFSLQNAIAEPTKWEYR